MSAECVRRYYGVDYKRGERVTVDGKPGVIVSFPGQYLGVRFDGERHTRRAHPTWRVERDPSPCPTPDEGCACDPPFVTEETR